MSNEQSSNNNLTQNIDDRVNLITSPNQPITQNKIPPPSSPRRFKTLKIILGIATILPIFHSIMSILLLPGSLSVALLLGILMFPIIGLGFILSLIYILIVFKNIKISKNKKAFWIVLFSTGISPILLYIPNLFYILSIIPINQSIFRSLISYLFVGLTPFISIAMLIYWYLYIWKEPKQNH